MLADAPRYVKVTTNQPTQGTKKQRSVSGFIQSRIKKQKK